MIQIVTMKVKNNKIMSFFNNLVLLWKILNNNKILKIIVKNVVLLRRFLAIKFILQIFNNKIVTKSL